MVSNWFELQGSDAGFYPSLALRPYVDNVIYEKYDKDNDGGGGSPCRPIGYVDWFVVWEEFSGAPVFNAYYPENALQGQAITVLLIHWDEIKVGESGGWVARKIPWVHGDKGLVNNKLSLFLRIALWAWSLYPSEWFFAFHKWFSAPLNLAEPRKAFKLMPLLHDENLAA